MKTVRAHYDEFLGSVYSWILGDFGNARGASEALFDALGITDGKDGLAVDLGCGPGSQSVPLAERGYSVIAIDFCQPLLDELASHAGDLPIRAVCDDIVSFPGHLPGPADLIVCMGDTLVHLPDRAAVDTVIDEVCAALRPGGQFVYAIRDYVSNVPAGAERFVPVRADDDRIFTCFLDYRDHDVHVHDILYQKDGGSWTLQVSDYRKLRLDSAEMNARLAAGGLDIEDSGERDGMIVVTARKRG